MVVVKRQRIGVRLQVPALLGFCERRSEIKEGSVGFHDREMDEGTNRMNMRSRGALWDLPLPRRPILTSNLSRPKGELGNKQPGSETSPSRTTRHLPATKLTGVKDSVQFRRSEINFVCHGVRVVERCLGVGKVRVRGSPLRSVV
jgi:hypothetical protein